MKIIKIGSNPSCDIVISSEFVSTHHADLTLLDNGDMVLEDCDSRNGTFIGNTKLTPGQEVPVKRGDFVKIANETLVWAKVPMPENNSRYKTIINIGSNYRNNIVINSPAVSRYHASLKIEKGGKAFIVDNNSKNGTQVNGVKIPAGKPTRIKRSDNVICGTEDISDQLKTLLKPSVPTWAWVSPLVAASVAALALLIVWLWPTSNDYRSAVVYVRAAYHYTVTLKDNPLPDSQKHLLEKETPARSYQATAFFLDREGRIATSRHIALPWEEPYREKGMTERLTQEYQTYIVKQLKVPNLNFNNLDEAINSLNKLSSTELGKALLDCCSGPNDLIAMFDRIKKSEIIISGEIDYIAVGYPGQYYTRFEEFQPCNVICESKNDDIDLAILQLNDKHTPDKVKYIFNPQTFNVKRLVPQKDKLFVLGFPHGLSWGMSEDTRSLEPTLKVTACTKPQGKYDIELQESAQGGSSGSPVYTEKGELVGVLSRGYASSTVTFAVLAKHLKKMYDEEIESLQ